VLDQVARVQHPGDHVHAVGLRTAGKALLALVHQRVAHVDKDSATISASGTSAATTNRATTRHATRLARNDRT
jgi:hypothetical protein